MPGFFISYAEISAASLFVKDPVLPGLELHRPGSLNHLSTGKEVITHTRQRLFEGYLYRFVT